MLHHSCYQFLDHCTKAEQYRGIFKNFSHFNFVQSKVFDDVSQWVTLSVIAEVYVLKNLII